MGSANIFDFIQNNITGNLNICDIEWSNFNQWSVKCGCYWVGPTTHPLLINACDVTKKQDMVE